MCLTNHTVSIQQVRSVNRLLHRHWRDVLLNSSEVREITIIVGSQKRNKFVLHVPGIFEHVFFLQNLNKTVKREFKIRSQVGLTKFLVTE